MIQDTVFGIEYLDFKSQPDAYIINNDDIKSGSAVRELNKLVGETDLDEIDTQAIAEVNYKRLEYLKTNKF